jgi:acetyltransferase-like isoleucine patch superfamily enzyme
LLKGSFIKDNSIIATGSVVTKAFEESNVIIAGSPAKIVKENVSWVRERI